ncbi:UNVERIFIED_CONTAM: hypothetical protein GTU68_060692 [Idotea baltica]|nr:hypothetical protein [Idotea baltica]
MSKVRVAVNGFGRIGRLTSRFLVNNPNVDLVAINDLTDNKTLAHLFKYDTAQGNFDGTVTASDDAITINGDKIAAFSERNPEALPWKDLGVDIVIESTGVFRNRDGAEKHITAGAKKVIISAPAKDADIKTIVLGVNDSDLLEIDTVLSNASCTTNCLAPMVKVLDDNLGLEYGLMTTTHAYTSDQRLQDAPHADLRRARAAAYNIIPTSTGAAIAVGKVLPHLNGKLNGSSMRVPVITGSITELNCITKKSATADEVNALFKAASEAGMKGVLQYSEEPLVSSDIIGNPYSCIFDSGLTMTTDKMIRVVGWYDNEAGYSNRLADLVERLS